MDAVKSSFSVNAFAYPPTNGKAACHIASANPVNFQGVAATGTRDFAIATEGVIHTVAAYATPNPAANASAGCDMNTSIYSVLN